LPHIIQVSSREQHYHRSLVPYTSKIPEIKKRSSRVPEQITTSATDPDLYLASYQLLPSHPHVRGGPQTYAKLSRGPGPHSSSASSLLRPSKHH